MRATMARQAEKLELASLLRALRAFTMAANDVKGGWQPQLPLELAIVECTAPLPIPAPELAAPTPTVMTAKIATPGPEAPKPDPTSNARKKPIPTAPPASKVSETPKASEASAGNQDVKAVWTRLLTMMREKDKPTTALLRSCTVLGLEGNTLLVATNEFVYKQISDRAETRTIINEVLTQTVGFPCTIQCQLTGAANKRSPEASDLPSDGMVATALRDLGGEIVE
jgi:DNA polymerase III subunit gamma/tau